MSQFLQNFALLIVLLNPFLVIVYLFPAVESLSGETFNKVLIRAGLISFVVFCLFAALGDYIFTGLFNASFASFQIFGGIILLLIGLQFVFQGPTAIEMLRGESEHITGAIAMPILIGPGTISGAVLIGKHLQAAFAFLTIFSAVGISIGIMLGLKYLHDYIKPRNQSLIERYIVIAGRLTALYTGTIAVDMMMQGIKAWLFK